MDNSSPSNDKRHSNIRVKDTKDHLDEPFYPRVEDNVESRSGKSIPTFMLICLKACSPKFTIYSSPLSA